MIYLFLQLQLFCCFSPFWMGGGGEECKVNILQFPWQDFIGLIACVCLVVRVCAHACAGRIPDNKRVISFIIMY